MVSDGRAHNLFQRARRANEAIGAWAGRRQPRVGLDDLILDPELLRSVRRLFNNGHHAQAVEQAYKLINNLVKKRVKTTLDGAPLMRNAFSRQNPILRLNALSNQSEQDEQQGYMDVLAGVMTGIRNPRAHEHDWEDTERRALELLILADHLIGRIKGADYAPE